MVIIVGSTLVAMAVAIAGVVRWSRSVAVAAFAVSAVVTAVYPGPGDNAVAAWLLVETVGQLVVLAQVTRRMPALAPLGVVAVAVSPLRIGVSGRHAEPGVGTNEDIAARPDTHPSMRPRSAAI